MRCSRALLPGMFLSPRGLYSVTPALRVELMGSESHQPKLRLRAKGKSETYLPSQFLSKFWSTYSFPSRSGPFVPLQMLGYTLLQYNKGKVEKNKHTSFYLRNCSGPKSKEGIDFTGLWSSDSDLFSAGLQTCLPVCLVEVVSQSCFLNPSLN